MRRAPALIVLLCCSVFAPLLNAQIAQVRIQVEPGAVGVIPDGFLGFGYETSAVAQPEYFTAKNARLVRLYANLGAHGLIRIGGNVSDHTRFLPQGTAAAKTERETTIINQSNLASLGEFARATGWQVMWGLNLGTGSPDQAADEAVTVQQALRESLHSFEIGNEVDILRRFSKDYAAYHTAFLQFKSAIRARVPSAVFSGPDVAGDFGYVEKFVANESGDLKLVTHHYYRAGARSANATIAYLLNRDAVFDGRLDSLNQLCRPHRLQFRINEVNSFYGGGKAGVSDTFTSALWCLDYMLNVAAHGGSGVNMETDINQLGFISHYSPIVHDSAGVCFAHPEYYAMLAFAMVGRGQLLKSDLAKPHDLNLTAYATQDAGGIVRLVLINKDLIKDAEVQVASPPSSKVTAYRLTAPSVDAKSGMTFAGSAVADDDSFTRGAGENLKTIDGIVRLNLPHAQAAVVELGQNLR
jgi:hypothetical protein